MKYVYFLFLFYPYFVFATANVVINDGSKIYYEGIFQDRADAERWVTEERTRPYWKSKFSVKITDNDAEEKAKNDAIKSEEIARLKKQKDRRDRIKSIDWNKVKTLEDLKPIIKDLVDDKD